MRTSKVEKRAGAKHRILASPPVRVLHLIASSRIGGGERYLLLVASHLDRQRYQVEVGCWEGGQLASALRERGISYHALLPFRRLSVQGLVSLTRWLRRRAPDILVTHSLRDHLYGRVASKLVGIPAVISTYHVTPRLSYWDVSWFQKAFYEWMDRLTLRWTDYCICLSEAVAEDLATGSKVPARKIGVVPNAVDPKEFRATSPTEAKRDLGFPEDAYVIGIVARLSPEKRHADLIHAVERLVGVIPEIGLAVVGDGSEEGPLRQLAARLGLEGTVRFVGFRQDVPATISAFDVAVLPSIMESAPTFLLEAMALSKPVIATRVGGVPEMVTDGVNGRLVSPGDIAALSEALHEIYCDRDRGKGWGEAGRGWVLSHCTPKHVIPALEAVYERVLMRVQ